MTEKPTPSLADLVAKREAEIADKLASRRRPGTGRYLLDGLRDELIKVLAETMLPVPEINEQLGKLGVQVNVKTLFRYLQTELPTEYEAYLKRLGNYKRPRKSRQTVPHNRVESTDRSAPAQAGEPVADKRPPEPVNQEPDQKSEEPDYKKDPLAYSKKFWDKQS